MARPVPNKTDLEIRGEWDAIARLRADQILSGRDLSYTGILVPSILRLAEKSVRSKVLDLGCGTGLLSQVLSQSSEQVVAIDSSPKSIEVARRFYGATQNLKFSAESLDSFSQQIRNPDFSLVVANMVLMNDRYLTKTLAQVRSVLRPYGHFIFSITHPCYWQFYKGYAGQSWFSYWEEIAIEANFDISLEGNSQLRTTHFHRPLEQYLTALGDTGFLVDEVLEPRPDAELAVRYPAAWQYPRFLVAICSAA